MEYSNEEGPDVYSMRNPSKTGLFTFAHIGAAFVAPPSKLYLTLCVHQHRK
jgi:hypothetical protein